MEGSNPEHLKRQAWRQASVFYFGIPALCAPSSSTYTKWLGKTCTPVGDDDLHTTSFLKHVACSGVGWVLYIIGVTGLLAPGLSFHTRPVGSGKKWLSKKEAFVVTRSFLFLQPIGPARQRLTAPGN